MSLLSTVEAPPLLQRSSMDNFVLPSCMTPEESFLSGPGDGRFEGLRRLGEDGAALLRRWSNTDVARWLRLRASKRLSILTARLIKKSRSAGKSRGTIRSCIWSESPLRRTSYRAVEFYMLSVARVRNRQTQTESAPCLMVLRAFPCLTR